MKSPFVIDNLGKLRELTFMEKAVRSITAWAEEAENSTKLLPTLMTPYIIGTYEITNKQ